MRLIIAGSRTITEQHIVVAALSKSGFHPSTIISGGAKGVDSVGESIAEELELNVERFPAEWDKYGKSAGYIRNVAMAENADALLAVWDGVSRGTKHMIDIARKKELPMYVFVPEYPRSDMY